MRLDHPDHNWSHSDHARTDTAPPRLVKHSQTEQSWFDTHREALLTTLFFAAPIIATTITASVEALAHRISPLAPDPRATIIALFINAAFAALGSGAAGFLTLRRAKSQGRVLRGLIGGGFGFCMYACLIVLYLALSVR